MQEFSVSTSKSEGLVGITAQVQGILLSLSRIVPKQVGCEHDENYKKRVVWGLLST